MKDNTYTAPDINTPLTALILSVKDFNIHLSVKSMNPNPNAPPSNPAKENSPKLENIPVMKSQASESHSKLMKYSHPSTILSQASSSHVIFYILIMKKSKKKN